MNLPVPNDEDIVVAIPSLIPAETFIGHRIWSDAGTKDTHGNKNGTYSSPAIARQAQMFYQAGTQQPVSPDYAARQVQELIVAVPDPDVYSKRDQVLIGGQAQPDGTYVGGRAFFMDGHPENFSDGSLMPSVTAGLGGQLHLKRVG